jgi:transposase
MRQNQKMYPDHKRIHLILDQAGYHTAQETRDFLKTSRIKVYYLPPRSPNLNPIERLWKIMHEYVSNNRVYERFKDFKKSLFDFFDHTMPNIKDILVSRITDNFQILPGN